MSRAGARGTRRSRSSGEAVPRAVLAAIQEEVGAISDASPLRARVGGRRRRVVRARARGGDLRAGNPVGPRRARRAAGVGLHPADRDAAAIPLPASDRAAGGVRRDPAGLAARRPRPGGGGARSGARPGGRPRPPRRKLGDGRRRARDRPARAGGSRRRPARAGGCREVAARGRPAAAPDRAATSCGCRCSARRRPRSPTPGPTTRRSTCSTRSAACCRRTGSTNGPRWWRGSRSPGG